LKYAYFIHIPMHPHMVMHLLQPNDLPCPPDKLHDWFNTGVSNSNFDNNQKCSYSTTDQECNRQCTWSCNKHLRKSYSCVSCH